MTERTNILLTELLGARTLTGVSRNDEALDETGRLHEVFRFTLDGITYQTEQDPEDDYRDSMLGCFASTLVIPQFRPVPVLASHRTSGEHGGKDDVLELREQTSGVLILETGTANIDDWYPQWVANWSPEKAGLTLS
jgi:hypothetical protein